MATHTASGAASSAGGFDLVDPRAPRFGQTLTAVGLAAGIALGEPLFVFGITAVLVVSVVSRWRVDLYGFLWQSLALSVVAAPERREPAAPHRFSKLMGAAFTAVASGFLSLGVIAESATAMYVGFAVAGIVALLAGTVAGLDYCIGCRLYQQVSFFRRLGLV
ncbi:DUF4395 domain-containing protein [Natronomonas gomsonensis]|uniref:DUF4395 domain-containing protein n=1 Tax=Natronomonas gomsonensis TaxID=1046043 RepID=UPI0015C0E7F8|nr:DUF4395 domain-containing protein [Natronomonas gomsonensis]